MSNQYEGSAIAESDEGLGLLVADNAAEQQDSLPAEMSSAQLLYSVVAHNVANPEKRVKLSPEQGKEIMKDFVDFVEESPDTPTNEDGRTKTFNEMDDNELLKCLSDYLGSAVANTSINGAGIEAAQELIAEQYMSDEELENLPDPKTANGKAAREKKFLERMRDAAEAEAAQLKENRDKWDKDDHDYGGEKLTGAEIMERINWFSKKENQDKVRNELIKNGKSAKEADEILAKMKERDELMKRQRDGIPPLTAEEKARLNALNKDQDVVRATKTQEDLYKAGRAANATIQNEQAKVADASSDQYELTQKRQMMSLSAEEQARLTKYEGDTKLQATNALIDQASASASTHGTNSEAYETFSSAPHVKEAFVTASIQTTQARELASVKPSAEQSIERPVITTAKVDAAANAFM